MQRRETGNWKHDTKATIEHAGHDLEQRGSRLLDQLHATIESAGQDLERHADAARRGFAVWLRQVAPSASHAGAKLSQDLRELARSIDAALFREGKPTGTA